MDMLNTLKYFTGANNNLQRMLSNMGEHHCNAIRYMLNIITRKVLLQSVHTIDSVIHVIPRIRYNL